MDQKIKELADSFFEWPTENKSFVTLTSALLFAEKIMERERERCAKIAEGFEAELNRLEAIKGTLGIKWQLIETAPKNSTLIVGYKNDCGKWRTVMGCFYAAGTLQNDPDGDCEEEYAPEGWYEESELTDYLQTIPSPTHWMPLPEPPVA
jgi:hypothetical protein